LTQSTNGTATTTYAYDHAGQRVKLTEGNTTTFFPNKLYETSTSKTTKHLFDTRGNLLATVETGSGGTSTTTTHSVYADALNGWTDWSWNTTLDPSNTSPVKTGTYSLKSTHNAAWGGMYLHHTGVNTSTSTHLAFSVRVPDAGAYIEIESYGPTDNLLATVPLNNYIPGGSMTANTWYDVNIPLADLAATSTTLTGIVAMRSTTGTAYWDDMKLVAQGSGGGGGTTIRYVHTDHLTGSNVVTDASGVLAETLDYYPYGGMRMDTKVGGYGGERRKFAGTEYDASTGLNQMGARYYASGKGKFLSEDPAFLELGGVGFSTKVSEPSLKGMGYLLDTSTRKNQNEKLLEMYLSNPQLLNSYSYVVNNPLKYRDEDGNTPLLLAIAGAGYGLASQYFNDLQEISAGNYNKQLSGREYGTSALKGVGVAFAGEAGVLAATGASVIGSVVQNGVLGRSQDIANITTDAVGTLITGGIVKQLPGSLSSLPKISSPQFNMEAVKTVMQNSTAEISFANAFAAIATQVKEIQQRINQIKKDNKK
jgi:RHS repeat-associated protein